MENMIIRSTNISMSPHPDISLYILTALVHPNDCGRRNLARRASPNIARRSAGAGCQAHTWQCGCKKKEDTYKNSEHITPTKQIHVKVYQVNGLSDSMSDIFLYNIKVCSKHFRQLIFYFWHGDYKYFWHISEAATNYHRIFLPSTK